MLKEKNGSLIHPVIEKETVLIHGTSIEATIHMLETGVFDYKIHREDKAQRYKNYLYFAPNGRYFERNNIGVDVDECTWKNSLSEAEIYAKWVADDHYIQSVAGFRPEYISELCEGWNWDIEKLLLPEFKLHGFNSVYLRKLLKDTDKRKGVILGFNEKILEKNIEKGRDAPHKEVCIYLPNGISIEYISGIQPIGEIEAQILRNITVNIPPQLKY
ncbi:MAG: hypothetical protein ACP5OA_05220 [Candidatus Woesearchaeota archaeon]